MTQPSPTASSPTSSSSTRTLDGKVAIVTGASKGIGASIAIHLAAAGAAVVVNYASSRAHADRVVAEIGKHGGRAIAVQADVSKLPEIERLVAETLRAFGRVDILINNAGIYEFAPLEAITPEHFHRHFDLNVLGLLLVTREFVKHVGPEGGSIVNISSGIVTLTPPNTAVYGATKAAVDAITMSLSKELAPRKIRVNSINPGMIETEGIQDLELDKGEFRAWVESTTPLRRIGQVVDVSPAVVFFASDDAGYITGETLHITGGSR